MTQSDIVGRLDYWRRFDSLCRWESDDPIVRSRKSEVELRRGMRARFGAGAEVSLTLISMVSDTFTIPQYSN